MLRSFVFAAAMLVPLAGVAQVRVDKLTFPPGTKHAEDFEVPVISGVDPRAAARINLAIQYPLLGIVPGRYRQPMFPDDSMTARTTSLSFTVIRADEQIVTLDIQGEYMGAHPSSGHTWMTFETRTGQPIATSDILTPSGIASSQKAVDKALRAGIRDVLDHQEPARFSDNATEAQDDMRTQREQYDECVGDMAQHDWNTTFQWGAQLTVSRGCMFPHVIQALDDAGEKTWTASYASLADRMTPFGRCLLVDRKANCKRDDVRPTAGVWRGTIGKAAISLLTQDDTLIYLYDRYGEAIALTARTTTPGHWVLERKDDTKNVLETFDLTAATEGGFTGTWTQAGKASLPVRLE